MTDTARLLDEVDRLREALSGLIDKYPALCSKRTNAGRGVGA
jgi:hypothetical protein